MVIPEGVLVEQSTKQVRDLKKTIYPMIRWVTMLCGTIHTFTLLSTFDILFTILECKQDKNVVWPIAHNRVI